MMKTDTDSTMAERPVRSRQSADITEYFCAEPKPVRLFGRFPDVDARCVEKLWKSKNVIRPFENDAHDSTNLFALKMSLWSKSPSMSRAGSGFQNFGSSCYLNAVLQCLLRSRYFLNGLIRLKTTDGDGDSLVQILEDLFRNYYAPEIWPFDNEKPPLAKMADKLPHLWDVTFLHKNIQSDPAELLYAMVENFESEGTELPAGLMHGLRVDKISCNVCGDETHHEAAYLTVDVPIKGFTTLQEALEGSFQTKPVDGKVSCTACDQKTEKTCKPILIKTPDILTVQLKRFERTYENGEMIMKKNSQMVLYTEQLDMDQFVVGKDGMGSLKYELTGFLVHVGGPQIGHYRAYVCDSEGRWYEKDDEISKHITQPFAMMKQAYVLFYSRRSPEAVEIQEVIRIKRRAIMQPGKQIRFRPKDAGKT